MTISPTLLAAHVLPPEYQGRPEAYLDDICLPLLPMVKKENLAAAVDIFCDHMAFNLSHVEKLFKAAVAQGLNVKLHADQLSSTHSVNVGAAYRALSADHLEYATESEIASMAESKMTAVLLPGAYYFLHQTKIPPIQWLREYHVPMALATDCNPGSSPCVSLPLMMNMAAVFWQITPVEALRGVTIHAAKALGMNHHYGSLELHKKADFVVWNVNHPDELTYQIGAFLPEKIVRKGVEIFHANSFI
ncbi:MAG: amidohydrolase family protein [Legionellales bacterium]|nr:amidohydrolase family protein [Legionellales bacterium]